MSAPDVDPRLSRLDARSPGAARLAELASLAVRVDTGLLRRLRQELSPDIDVAAESELWFSSIVESRSETGFQIAPDIVEELRTRLTSLPKRPSVAQVRSVLTRAHANVSPAIRLEETINAIALEQGGTGRQAIEEELRPALATLARGDEAALDVARWAVLAVQRLHPVVRETMAARTLVLSAALLLRGRARIGGVPEPATRISALGWALPGSTRSKRFGVEFVPGGLQFRPASDAVGQFDAPLTDPVIVEVEWRSGGTTRQRLTRADEDVLVALDGDPSEVTLTTLLGDQYIVTSARGAATSWRRAVPPADLLESCRQVEPLGQDQAIGVVFAVGERLLLGVDAVVGSYPIVGVVGDSRQLEIVPGHRRESGDRQPHAVAFRPMDAADPVWRPLALMKSDEVVARAAAAGFATGRAEWYDVVLEQAGDRVGARRGGLLLPADLAILSLAPNEIQERLTVAFAGAPLVTDSAVGMIARISPPQPQEQYAPIEIVDVALLRDAIARVESERPPAVLLVFISYAKEDHQAALRVKKSLEERGHSVFIDLAGLDAGADWLAEIERAIERSDIFLPVISSNALARRQEFVLREWGWAEQKRRRLPARSTFIVPVVIDDTPSTAMPGAFRELQWIRAPGGELPLEVFMMLDDVTRRRAPADYPDGGARRRPSQSDDLLWQELIPPPLRETIQALFARTGPPIVLISGPPRSALDEVPRYIGRRGSADTDAVVILLDLASHGAALRPTDLVTRMALAIGIDSTEVPRFENEPSARAVRRLALWWMSAKRRSARSAIFTLHGFESAPIDPDVADFLNEWMSEVAAEPGGQRLILINYPLLLPRQAELVVQRFTLEPVVHQDVSRFFEAVFAASGRAYEPAAVEEATQRVFESVLASPLWEYGELRTRLQAAASLLLRDSSAS